MNYFFLTKLFLFPVRFQFHCSLQHDNRIVVSKQAQSIALILGCIPVPVPARSFPYWCSSLPPHTYPATTTQSSPARFRSKFEFKSW